MPKIRPDCDLYNPDCQMILLSDDGFIMSIPCPRIDDPVDNCWWYYEEIV